MVVVPGLVFVVVVLFCNTSGEGYVCRGKLGNSGQLSVCRQGHLGSSG